MLAFHRTTGEGFAAGTLDGVELTAEGIGGVGTWIGPWIATGFAIASIVPSWNAETPEGAVVEVELQGTTERGEETPWFVLGRWSLDDASFRRTSVAGQAGALGTVDVDTLRCVEPFDSYRIRLRLQAGRSGRPIVRQVTAIAAGEPFERAASHASFAGSVELPVPPFSQRTHDGEYPEYDGGGASWCSPTSTAMVLAYWGRGPTAAELAWVGDGIADPSVVHAARHVYDHGYAGTGNWPFNAAYAAHFDLAAFVTRLRSLAEAGLWLRAGVPLVASIAAGPGELTGFQAEAGTSGHLVVVIGLTETGDPIVNDPAAPSNEEVRRVYDREEFERAWLRGSGGIVYVITPQDHALPPSQGNW